MRTAVVGTSHANSIYESLHTPLGQKVLGSDSFCFSLSAPILSKENWKGWGGTPRGVMKCETAEGQASTKRLFGDASRTFDPVEFDRIVLVDFFFCCDFAWQLRDQVPNQLAIGGFGVSSALFREVLKSRLGKSAYVRNSLVGDVPENDTIPLIRDMRERAPEAEFFLAPRPLQVEANRGALHLGLTRDQMNASLLMFDDACAALLATFDIRYIPQSRDTLSEKTGLTRDCYSTGPLPNGPRPLNEHLTGAYGQSVLMNILGESEGVAE